MRVLQRSIMRMAAVIAVAGAAVVVGTAGPAEAVTLYTCNGGSGSSVAGPTSQSPTGYGMQGSITFTSCGSGGSGGSATAIWNHRAALYWTTCAAPPSGVVAAGYASIVAPGIATGEFPFSATASASATGVIKFSGSIQSPSPATVTFTMNVSVTCGSDGNIVSTTSTLVGQFVVTSP
jgi:hypothetical protein